MSVGIRIQGLREVQELLGQDFAPTIRTATKAIALEVQGKIAPYPPATAANSSDNATGRWYERGYGPRWWVKGAALSVRYGRKKVSGQRRELLQAARRGMIRGRKTSQMMNRGWSIRPHGRTGWVVGNRADYSGYLHSQEIQARWAGQRGWQTDEAAVAAVVKSGAVQRIVTQAVMARLRRRP